MGYGDEEEAQGVVGEPVEGAVTALVPSVRRTFGVAGGAAVALAVAVGLVSGQNPGSAMPTMHHDRTDASCPVAAPSPALSKFTEPLTVPARVDLRDGGVARLDMRSGTHRFHRDLPPTPTLGYVNRGSADADVYAGPTIEARRGVPATVVVRNRLGTHPLADSMDHTLMGMTPTDEMAPRGVVHLHGAHSEPSQDGLPTDTFRPGQATTYRYVNDQEATGLWYHDHSWGMTRLQVVSGLTGQYWLRDDFDTGRPDNPLGLPAGDYEIPLTLQDRSFNSDGSLAYASGPFCGLEAPEGYPNQWSPEFFGDVAVVNGTATPNLDVARGLYRFRVLNGSNARFYHVDIPTGLRVYQIGTDGGLLDAPVRLRDLLLAPAERADLLVDLRAAQPGARFVLRNDANSPFGGLDASPDDDEAPLPDLMQLTVTEQRGLQADVPRRLRGGPGRPEELPTMRPTNTRTVSLNEIADPAVDEPVHGHINNQFFADATGGQPRTTEIESPRLNSVEMWQIVNATGDAHPIHLHMTQFRVLDRQAFDEPGYTAELNTRLPAPGLPDPSVAGLGPWPAPDPGAHLVGRPRSPDANERGWKDTVVAPPGQVTRILVPFGGTAAGVPAPFTGDAEHVTVQRFAGTYVFHCHILEHEDNDMMQPYVIR